MRKITILIFSFFIMICMDCQKMVDIPAEKAAIKSVLETFRSGIENGDLTLINRVVAQDTDNVFIGTNAEEIIVGWNSLGTAIKQQSDALSETQITQKELTIKVLSNGKFAYTTSQYDVKAIMGEQEIALQAIRGTCVLEKRNGNWMIVHTHDSIGAQ